MFLLKQETTGATSSCKGGQKRNFSDAVAVFPGSAHDARVLRNSNIYQEAEQGNILQAPQCCIYHNMNAMLHESMAFMCFGQRLNHR